jgi:Holliday junction resolvase
MTGGRRSRDKGARAERALVRFLQERGFAAQRVPLSGSAGGRFAGDITIPLFGVDRIAEVKVRGSGFRQLYEWLEGRDLLIVRADRRRPLVVLPLKLAANIVEAVGQSKTETTITTFSAIESETASSTAGATSNAMNRKGEIHGIGSCKNR